MFTIAPVLPRIESVVDRNCGDKPTVIRAHVYDNAPYYITWYNDTFLDVTVDGHELPPIEAMSSQGQIFRAVRQRCPGRLVDIGVGNQPDGLGVRKLNRSQIGCSDHTPPRSASICCRTVIMAGMPPSHMI